MRRSGSPRAPRAAATVEFRHVTKRLRRAARRARPGAVNDLSLTVPAGKICVLVGPSGCGKTTSLKMVNRLIEPTSGQILIDGDGRHDARRRSSCAAASATSSSRSGCSRTRPSADNVAVVPRLLGWPSGAPEARADELLDAGRPRPGAATATATRASSPAASASASAWRGRWPPTRR